MSFFNESPPTSSHYEVTLFPGYLNPLKLIQLAIQIATGGGVFRPISRLLIAGGLAGATVGLGSARKPESKSSAEVGLALALGINPLDSKFASVSGLGSKLDTQEVTCGGLNTETIQMPTRVTHDNLVLERGIFVGSPLTLEFNVAMNLFTVFPGDILVTLMNTDDTPLAAWFFRNAYPVSWSNSDLKFDNNDIFQEKMEFAYTHMYAMRV